MCLFKKKEEIRKKALALIGNGFDCALSYETSYKYFYQSDEFYQLVEKDNNQLCRYIHIKTSHGDKWADMENCLYSYSKFITEQYGVNNVEQKKIFYQDFILLKEAFYNYLKKEVHLPHDFEEQEKPSKQIAKVIQIWGKLDLQILNFNYTPFSAIFFENHLNNNGETMYGKNVSINSSKYIYQHCSLFDTSKGQENSSTDIVLGIDRYNQIVEDCHQFLYKDNQSPALDEDSYTKLIQEKDVFFIFGCSMGRSDSSYFYSLFQNQREKPIIIYGYGKKEIEQLTDIVSDMGGNISKISYVDDSDLNSAIIKTKKIISSL